MITPELIFVQLTRQNEPISAVELAMMLESSVPQIRHKLKQLGDRVEFNNKDEWYVVSQSDLDNELLSVWERQLRDRLEDKVDRAFYTLGKSLRELRDRRLYRETHSSFVDYLKDRFRFSKPHAYRLIDAANITDNIQRSPIWRQTQTNVLLPNKESQIRGLIQFEPQQQPEIWFEAVSKSKGKQPTGKIVRQTIKERQAKILLESKLTEECTEVYNQDVIENSCLVDSKVIEVENNRITAVKEMSKEIVEYSPSNRLQVDDVVLIDGTRDENLKYYHSCWGQIVSVEEHSYTLAVGTEVLNAIVRGDLSLIENADKLKAKDFVTIALRFKMCEQNLIGDLQFLIRPAISNVSTVTKKVYK